MEALGPAAICDKFQEAGGLAARHTERNRRLLFVTAVTNARGFQAQAAWRPQRRRRGLSGARWVGRRAAATRQATSFAVKTWIRLPHHQSKCRARRPLVTLESALWLACCATAPDAQSNALLQDPLSIERQAVTCNRSIASDIRYQHLASLLPLAAPYQASVVQMTNTDRASADEIRALTGWTQDIQKCRRDVIALVRLSPISLALVLSAWADEDEVFVGVIQRKLSWGAAATRLRAIQVRLLSNLTDRAIQVDAQLNSAKQAELARRVAVRLPTLRHSRAQSKTTCSYPGVTA